MTHTRTRANAYKGHAFTVPAELYGPALAAALAAERAWIDAALAQGTDQLDLFAVDLDLFAVTK